MLHAPTSERTREPGGKGRPLEPRHGASALQTPVPERQVAAPRPQEPALRPSQGGLLQRKCVCGGAPGPTGECAACRAKRLGLQRHAAEIGLISIPGDGLTFKQTQIAAFGQAERAQIFHLIRLSESPYIRSFPISLWHWII